MEHIWDFASTVDVEDVRSILEPADQVQHGHCRGVCQGSYGANIGSVLLDMEEQ